MKAVRNKKNGKSIISGITVNEVLIAAFAVIIFIANIGIVGKCYNPFVFNDEMGYWTHAATIAGYDWRGVGKTLAWYSFGYSFLLAPFMKLISDPVMLYRTMLIMNIVMEIASYFLYIYILRFLFPKVSRLYAGAVSAAAILYTSYQFNAGITMTEAALLFVTVLITALLIRAIKKPTYLNTVCLGLLCAYIYMIHNRCIGVAASVVLAILLCLFFKKVDLRHGGAFLGALIVGFAANTIIRRILESYIWSGNAGGNNAEGMVNNLKASLSSFDGIKRLLSVMASQAFAFCAATMCVGLFALWGIFRFTAGECVNVIKASRKKKRSKSKRSPDARIYVMIFIFCAFISSWLISSIFMYTFSRIDHIIYTRYFDMTVGMLIMTGLCFMQNIDKKDMIFIFAVPGIMLAGANRASSLIGQVSSPVFNKVCAPGLCLYYEKYGTVFNSYAIAAAAIFGLLLIISSIKKRNIGLYAASAVLAATFTHMTPSARLAIEKNQEAYAGDRQLIERVRDIPAAEFRAAENSGTFLSFLQYMLPDKTVRYADSSDEIGDNVYIFANKSDLINMPGYEIVDSSDRHILMKGAANGETSANLPLSFMNVFDNSCYIEETDDIKSDPVNNYLCYGPYVDLDEGDHTFTLDLDFAFAETENIGFAEVKSTSLNTVYAHEELTSDMIGSDGNVEIDLDFANTSFIPDLEIVVFLYEPSKVNAVLDHITVKD